MIKQSWQKNHPGNPGHYENTKSENNRNGGIRRKEKKQRSKALKIISTKV